MNSSNWWAQKLGGQPAAPQPKPQQFVAPMQPPPAYQHPQSQMPPQEAPRLPQSALTSSRCPGCGSGNYGGATPEARPRCYDCGYPLTQTGTGMPGVNAPTSGPTQASRQVATGGWNPTTIIGKIEG